MRRRLLRPVDAAVAVPIAFLGMLAIGGVAVVAAPADRTAAVLALTCLLVAAAAFLARASALLPTLLLGWFTVAGFARAPLGDLHGVPASQLVAMCAAGLGGEALGLLARAPVRPTSATLDGVHSLRFRSRPAHRSSGLARRRRVAAMLLAAGLLPGLTAAMVAVRPSLALVDDLLFYLLAVVAVTLVGGFWPAVAAALTASLLLNWFFTPPVHTWTIEDPTNLLALLLFVATAVTVSSVVHLAARRDAVAAARTAEADALLALARTVLRDDRAETVLGHLHRSLGLSGVLEERVAGSWVRVAGRAQPQQTHVVAAGDTFRLRVCGPVDGVSDRLLDGFAAQAAAACERQRLRTQAQQAEALEAGNRMRTALLTAVSHDLRTPLASVKASVSTLRQQDVAWSPADRAALLATIEEGADRLGALIGNLLDMSRIQTGAIEPFLRDVALDEVIPAAVRDVDGGSDIVLDVPDDLPLVRTDPVLLERAVANLVSNAVRHASISTYRPRVVARASDDGTRLTIDVVDQGPGIPAAERDRAFQPFQQLGDQRGSAGVGLGLAVTKGFVDALGGHVQATETPGGGLTVRIELPARAAAHAAAVRS